MRVMTQAIVLLLLIVVRVIRESFEVLEELASF